MHFASDGPPAALWAWHRPAPGKAVRADGLDAWACTLFRVELRTVLASELIREAAAIAVAKWRPLPADGLYTTVNPHKVPATRVRGRDVWGYCYIKAGWQVREARTKDKDLVVLTLSLNELRAIAPVAASIAMPPWGIAWRRWPRTNDESQLSLGLEVLHDH